MTAVNAEFWHFASVTQELTVNSARDWMRCWPTAPMQNRARGINTRFGRPRLLGTISPWSSKAADIAHNCGLDAVQRIERGVWFWVSAEKALTTQAKRAIGMPATTA